MKNLSIILLKIYTNIVLISHNDLDWTEKLWYWFKSSFFWGVCAFILAALNIWYLEHSTFSHFVIAFIIVNAGLGAYVHWFKIRDFDLMKFFNRTALIIFSMIGVYFVLEGLATVAGENPATDYFRATFQIMTLLLPGSKILKNFHILTDGDYPPGYIMKRIYDFNKNGDLKTLLKDESKS